MMMMTAMCFSQCVVVNEPQCTIVIRIANICTSWPAAESSALEHLIAQSLIAIRARATHISVSIQHCIDRYTKPGLACVACTVNYLGSMNQREPEHHQYMMMPGGGK